MACAPNLFTYVVAHDSGFAPNPFCGVCTLATCKPRIREQAQVGDWIVGTGSNDKRVRRGGFLVHAMRVEESLTFGEYWNDPRFSGKKPNLHGSYRMACGDNIYCPNPSGFGWLQSNSYHSKKDGTSNRRHIERDTSVDRVLVSHQFVYFGAQGPKIPGHLRDAGLVHAGRMYKRVRDPQAIAAFEAWLKSLGGMGYQGKPYDMLQEERQRR